MSDETRPKMTPEELADAILSGNPPAVDVELVSSRPTAADLRAYADAWQRGSAVEPAICRYLRAGADAMDERDEYESLYRNLQREMAAAQKIIVSQGAELAQLKAERDAVDGYIAELNAALAQDRAELARLRIECDGERKAKELALAGLESVTELHSALKHEHREAQTELARLRAENAELAEALRELMASDEGRGPTEQALSRAAAVLAKRESVE